jgi:hypothetical protein
VGPLPKPTALRYGPRVFAILLLLLLLLLVIAAASASLAPYSGDTVIVVFGVVFTVLGVAFWFILETVRNWRSDRAIIAARQLDAWSAEREGLVESGPTVTGVTAPTVTVTSRSPTLNDVVLQAIWVTVIAVLFVIFASGDITIGGRPSIWFDYGFLIAMTAVDVALVARTHVTRIDIDPKGVTFYYPFNRERGAWDDLSPWPKPLSMGVWWIQRRQSPGRSPAVRGHSLTRRQAQAVWNYPVRPTWRVAPSVLRSLGLPAPSSP